MKKLFFTLSFMLLIGLLAYSQSTESLINKCVENAGNGSVFLKDYRIKMGEASSGADLRHKANFSFWKGMTYRITMCCFDIYN